MLETFLETSAQTVRGNRALIVLRLLLASVSLTVLLLADWSRANAGRARQGLIRGGAREISALTFLDDRRLASAGADAAIRFWDLETGKELAGPPGLDEQVFCLLPSPDRSRLAASSEHGIHLLDLKANRWEQSVRPPAPAFSLAWLDNRTLAFGGEECPVRVWDVQSGQVREAKPEIKGIVFLAVCGKEQDVVAVSADGKVRVWPSAELSNPRELVSGLGPIRAAAGGDPLLTGSGFLGVWANGKLAQALEPHEGGVTALAASASGAFLSLGPDQRLILWKWEGGGLRKALEWNRSEEEAVLALALSPNGRWVALGAGDRGLRILDGQTGQKRTQFLGHGPARLVEVSFGKTGPRSPVLFRRVEYLVVVIVLVLTVFYLLALRRKELAGRLAILQTSVDVGLITALVYHTQGVESPFVSLYLVSLVGSGFLLSRRTALILAALAAAAFAVVTLLYGLNVIPEAVRSQLTEAQLRRYRSLNLLVYFQLLLLPVLAFFISTLLASTLARRLALARLVHHDVLEGLGEGLLVVDRAFQVMYRNPEAGKMLNLAPGAPAPALEQLLGTPVLTQAERALAESASRKIEITYNRSDGLLIPFSVRLLPVQNPDGPAPGLVVVLNDITAEKKMEEFYKHKERLETMGQLSATIAHEIRNPLASIRGAVQEIAHSVPIPEDKKILVEIVLTESDRLDQIISDFLRFARVRAPKLGATDVGGMLEEVRVLLLTRPEARGMEIRLESQEEPPEIQADHDQLRQVFLNLAINALHALEGRTERRLTFRLRPLRLFECPDLDKALRQSRVDRPGVLVEVEDTGCGMAEEVRRQVFEPFYTTKPSGTGLGLAIVARIVQAHDGVVNVVSQAGAGSTFRIWLPSDLQAEKGTEAQGR